MLPSGVTYTPDFALDFDTCGFVEVKPQLEPDDRPLMLSELITNPIFRVFGQPNGDLASCIVEGEEVWYDRRKDPRIIGWWIEKVLTCDS
jgi:hypothetical protein